MPYLRPLALTLVLMVTFPVLLVVALGVGLIEILWGSCLELERAVVDSWREKP